jgi:hypothetical protein
MESWLVEALHKPLQAAAGVGAALHQTACVNAGVAEGGPSSCLWLWPAQVYKAMRRRVQECAVKILRNVNETELSNFQREVYIMQQCSFDRNIVQFYGAAPLACMRCSVP